jgi:outer membrane translocation and assembly module TamA
MDDRAFKVWFVRWRMGLALGAFGDVGTAWTSSEEFGDNFIGGFGGGVRLTMPVVVLLRLDVGYSQRGFGLQVHVGGAEKAEAQRKRVR